MSKSMGNLVLVSELRESGIDPMAIRLALLASHYRDDWDWTDELLASATQRLDRWREAVRLDAGMNADETISSIRAALDENLNAPAALAAVDAWAGASTAIDADDVDAPALIAQACDALLGVRL
jgi:L-cysteine:1D-myo-inositol 2-amino-2-deoxy-alpha-D-glucopyranoside ligase